MWDTWIQNNGHEQLTIVWDHKNGKKQITYELNIIGLKILNGERQTSWLFRSMIEELN